jgi:hypothetical protein
MSPVPAPVPARSLGEVNKKANWVTVSLPRALVRDLRATADSLGLSVVQVVELSYNTFTLAKNVLNDVPAPTPEPEPARPDAVQVGRFVYPKKG